MRAVVSVIGKDTVGILAKTTAVCAEHHVNVVDVTQSVLQDLFAMIMLIDVTESDIPLTQLTDRFEAIGKEMGLSIHVMHEDVFNAMHTV
ncbi:MAG: ACT domain-containing protein [Clostridia bacterium]|nr:ACT domain-containing protein [Clostridia bacterium]